MKYLVMECHPGYAVVLSQDGRFIKAANLNYDVGETVCDIIIMDVERRSCRRIIAAIISLAILAAAIIFCGWYFAFIPVGTVDMTVNAEVQLKVNRLNYVVGLESMNEAGRVLVNGHSYLFKKSEELADELIETAYSLDYLDDGGVVLISVDSDDEGWLINAENRLLDRLSDHSKHGVSVVIADPDVNYDDIISAESADDVSTETSAETTAE